MQGQKFECNVAATSVCSMGMPFYFIFFVAKGICCIILHFVNALKVVVLSIHIDFEEINKNLAQDHWEINRDVTGGKKLSCEKRILVTA